MFPLVGVLLLVTAWWAVKVANGWSAFILPSPAEVVLAVAQHWNDLVRHSAVTVWETTAGYLLAVVVAVPIGVALAYSSVFDRMFSPTLFGFNAVPKVAVAPLLVIWLGFGQLPKITMVVLLAFFPIALSTAAGLKSTPAELRELVRSLGATPIQAFFKVRLPSALPHLFVGLKVAISLAIIGAVIGEFVGATEGLGYVIVASGGSADTTLAFAALVLLAGMSIGLYYLLSVVERLAVPWAEEPH
jgi:NitT/TauT family transport system permease protein